MSEVAWLPSLLVLAIGLAVGLGASYALRRGRRKPAKAQDTLRRRDLEERRDELYRRLRSPDLNSGDRESLELAAAHTLRELDRLPTERPARRQSAAKTAAVEAATETPAAETAAAPAKTSIRHPALVGFVAGMAVVLLVGWLVYLAVRDSGVRQAEAPAGAPLAGTSDRPHPDATTLSPEVQQELQQLEAAATAAPNDITARKRLALGRLSAGLYFEAYRDAETILAGQPEDPDGLFIQGVVQLSMGQAAEAVELLDRVIVRYPEHIQAMVYRGLALAQSGDLDQAIATWEMGLSAAGGSHPDLESLLQRAYAEAEAEAAAPEPPPAAPAAAEAPPAAPATPAPAAPAAPSGPSYPVTVSVEPGLAAPPGAVLFVFLRPGESGPPIAVKRIASPRFPLELALGADDAMMAGSALPDLGTLVARLSTSGSANRGPGDLEASAAATLGQPTRLVLGGS